MDLLSKILIVDDDVEMVRLLVELLRGCGCSLRVALSAEDGLRAAVTNDPDVILLDVNMPEVNGLHLCRLLKSDPRTVDIPVIFLTGRDGTPDRLKGYGAGASDYITKPFSAEELIARIKVHVQMRHRLRNLSVSSRPLLADLPESGTESMLQQVQTLLRSNLVEPPSLMELARQMGTNERRLSELFRQQVGMPVFAWLREVRFQRACELLLETELDIGQIAAAVGYANQATFATAFRERYGLKPSNYRRSAGLNVDDSSGGSACEP
ncbi:MAG: response regulator transcription factor [Methylococcaceae bacterium]